MKNSSRFCSGLIGRRRAVDVAQADAGRAPQAQLEDRVFAERDRIFEEAAEEIDPRFAIADQHHAIGIGSGRRAPSRHAARGPLIGDLVLAGLVGNRHELEPPIHHPIRLGKETMRADVDAVALVVDRAGNAPHVRALLQHDRDDVGAGQQFVGGGQSGRTGTDDHGVSFVSCEFMVEPSPATARPNWAK